MVLIFWLKTTTKQNSTLPHLKTRFLSLSLSRCHIHWRRQSCCATIYFIFLAVSSSSTSFTATHLPFSQSYKLYIQSTRILPLLLVPSIFPASDKLSKPSLSWQHAQETSFVWSWYLESGVKEFNPNILQRLHSYFIHFFFPTRCSIVLKMRSPILPY